MAIGETLLHAGKGASGTGAVRADAEFSGLEMTLRASAWLALVHVAIRLGATVVSAIYAPAADHMFRPSEAPGLALVALLVIGAVSAFRSADNRYLILAWAFAAGMAFPMLFEHPEFPERLKHAISPQAEAMIRNGWEYSLRFGLYAAAAHCTVAVIGLVLCLASARPRTS